MKKIKIIGILGIISLILHIFSIIMFIVFIFSTFSNSNNPDSYAVFSGVALILGFISAIPAGIISVTASILILATNFENKEINESKILWGVLSLVILGPIGVIIFAGINYKTAAKNIDNQIIDNIKTPNKE